MTRKYLSPVLQALAAAVLFGASAPFAKLLLGEIAPVPLAALWYLGSGVSSFGLLLMQAVYFKKPAAGVQFAMADLPWLAGAVMAGGVIAPILLMWGLTRTPASTASLLLNFESVATTLIAIFAFKEGVGRRGLLAMILIALASIILGWSGGSWGISAGALGVIGACFLWGLDNNFTRHIAAKNPLLIVGVKGLGAGSFSLLLAVILGDPLPRPAVILPALLLGALSYGVSIQLFILAMRGLGAARTSMLFASAPFAGTLLAFILLREVPQLQFWAAIPVMLGGAWLMLSENHGHHHIHLPDDHTHDHWHPDDHHVHEHIPISEPPDANRVHSHTHTHAILAHEHTHTPDLDHMHEHPDHDPDS